MIIYTLYIVCGAVCGKGSGTGTSHETGLITSEDVTRGGVHDLTGER